MSRAVVFKSVSGINCEMGQKPSPVRALEPHIAFYTDVLGFTLSRRDQQSAALERDGVQIEPGRTSNPRPWSAMVCKSNWCAGYGERVQFQQWRVPGVRC